MHFVTVNFAVRILFTYFFLMHSTQLFCMEGDSDFVSLGQPLPAAGTPPSKSATAPANQPPRLALSSPTHYAAHDGIDIRGTVDSARRSSHTTTRHMRDSVTSTGSATSAFSSVGTTRNSTSLAQDPAANALWTAALAAVSGTHSSFSSSISAAAPSSTTDSLAAAPPAHRTSLPGTVTAAPPHGATATGTPHHLSGKTVECKSPVGDIRLKFGSVVLGTAVPGFPVPRRPTAINTQAAAAAAAVHARTGPRSPEKRKEHSLARVGSDSEQEPPKLADRARDAVISAERDGRRSPLNTDHLYDKQPYTRAPVRAEFPDPAKAAAEAAAGLQTHRRPPAGGLTIRFRGAASPPYGTSANGSSAGADATRHQPSAPASTTTSLAGALAAASYGAAQSPAHHNIATKNFSFDLRRSHQQTHRDARETQPRDGSQSTRSAESIALADHKRSKQLRRASINANNGSNTGMPLGYHATYPPDPMPDDRSPLREHESLSDDTSTHDATAALYAARQLAILNAQRKQLTDRLAATHTARQQKQDQIDASRGVEQKLDHLAATAVRNRHLIIKKKKKAACQCCRCRNETSRAYQITAISENAQPKQHSCCCPWLCCSC